MDNLSFFLIKFALKTFLFERVKRASLKVLANEFRKIKLGMGLFFWFVFCQYKK
jgi:hypothetical protein